ncbi:signal peptidase II, partial [Staphylococcus epidermidis]|uniref:signal peptidase II n=1 Tax=Staphylococcus epidermidis TaxID=1282 RepID=UPI001EF96C05
MKKKYYISISLLMTIIVLVFDQISKWLITISMKVGDSYEIIPNFLNITSHRNNGAACGFFTLQLLFFYIITLIILIVLVTVSSTLLTL